MKSTAFQSPCTPENLLHKQRRNQSTVTSDYDHEADIFKCL